MVTSKRPLIIDDLEANRYMVSVHKYGFFLCTKGNAKILLGSNIYQISRNCLCFYAPNTFFQILEKSGDLQGILEEADVETYFPILSGIDIRSRMQVRKTPCVEISDMQVAEVLRLYDIVRGDKKDMIAEDDRAGVQNNLADVMNKQFFRHIRYSICLKVLELYFRNTPVKAMPHDREDAILNQFLVSVYENCHSHRTVQYYADEQRLSSYYFSSIIRNRSGKSAMQWIGGITIMFSKQYLECSEMSIKEIADRMNFPDQSSFGRYFKHHEGCSPSEYRERRLQD